MARDGQTGESLAEALVAHAECVAQAGPRQAAVAGPAEGIEDGGVEVDGGGSGRWMGVILRLVVEDCQMQGVLGAGEGESQRVRCRCGTMLDREHEPLSLTVQAECGVDPGEEITRAAQALAAWRSSEAGASPAAPPGSALAIVSLYGAKLLAWIRLRLGRGLRARVGRATY